MLNTIYKEAIKKRKEIISSIKGPAFKEIITLAKKNWTEYIPKKKSVSISGIDSSFNSVKFQGIELWAVTAVSIRSNGEIIADLHDHGVGLIHAVLSSLASRMEIDACNMSIDKTDLVLIDGSLYSQFMTRQKELASLVVNIVQKNDNVVFISKTSNTRNQFIDFNPTASDIFYYNHATKKPGFSKIITDKRFGANKCITSVFVRLGESTPIIKIEFLGDRYTGQEIKTILDKLYNNSIGGYPYSLKLAHQKCKISNVDLAKLVSLYGLTTEIGSREVLE